MTRRVRISRVFSFHEPGNEKDMYIEKQYGGPQAGSVWRKMLKRIFFAVLWLPCAAVFQVQGQDDINSSFKSNLGHDIKTECKSFLTLFSKATKEYDICAVKYAKPLRFCEMCPSKYANVLKYNPAKFNDSRCVSDLVSSERLQLVMKVYDFQTALWKEAHCEKCYIPEAESQMEWNQTHLTKEFFQKLSLVHSCFKNYSKKHTNKSTFQGEDVSNASVCVGCRDYFSQLRSTYINILDGTEDENEDLLCADIMSAMNDTRKDWKRNNCFLDQKRNYTDLLLSFGIFLSTFIFYVGVQRHEKYKMKMHSYPHYTRKEVNYDSE